MFCDEVNSCTEERIRNGEELEDAHQKDFPGESVRAGTNVGCVLADMNEIAAGVVVVAIAVAVEQEDEEDAEDVIEKNGADTDVV